AAAKRAFSIVGFAFCKAAAAAETGGMPSTRAVSAFCIAAPGAKGTLKAQHGITVAKDPCSLTADAIASACSITGTAGAISDAITDLAGGMSAAGTLLTENDTVCTIRTGQDFLVAA